MAAVLAPTVAAASNPTTPIYGCQGSYSGKVAVGNCNPATKTMDIKILGDCSGAQGGYDSGFKHVWNSIVYTPYASASCIWNVTSIAQAVA